MAALTQAEIMRVGTDPVPTEPYWSEDYFALERKNLFARRCEIAAAIGLGTDGSVAHSGSLQCGRRSRACAKLETRAHWC
jgi:hypothetical protein